MTAWKPASGLLILSLLAGCSGGGSSATTAVGTGQTPEQLVTSLIEHLDRAEFEVAGTLTVPGQAALASLAEGATFSDVAEGLREGDSRIASNFWSGFAQGAGGYLAGAVVTGTDDTVTKDGVDFHPVEVRPQVGPIRRIFVRGGDADRIDLFASFAPGLADRMPSAVERLLTTNTDDAGLILQELEAIVPSLLVAAEIGDQPTEATQQILRLVE
ncbi:MAG: hypothetical protein ACRDVL_00145, partial [Acidimicrobiia bacterium]